MNTLSNSQFYDVRSYLRYAPDLIFEYFQNGQIRRINHPVGNPLFRKELEGDGEQAENVLPETFRLSVEAHLSTVLQTKEPAQFMFETKEGKRLQSWSVQLAYLSPTRALVIVRQLKASDTQLRRNCLALEKRVAVQERELQEATDAIAKLKDSMREFFYIASHDLQEPLRTISSFLQLLERRYSGQLDETGMEFVEYAIDGADRMRELMDDLLVYSRIYTRHGEKTAVSTQIVVDMVLNTLEKMIADNQGQISFSSLPVVRGNELLLIQLFQHLIENALKFRSEAPPVVAITAVYQPTSHKWQFAVQDNGIGIAATYHERIFQMFQRLHSRQEIPGTGIGLAICQKIVEEHGGTIWVESSPQEGATFFFTLPAELS